MLIRIISNKEYFSRMLGNFYCVNIQTYINTEGVLIPRTCLLTRSFVSTSGTFLTQRTL
ncbi:hypothetical protein BIW11_13002 [Tropilaelaps mercedesae]|uniref:Uncharacterized protein n=1 Tax=Tropilaelaps mercedesae TaxID=418985 RepID=A0A1V9X4J5_9ACAR|nr:hypothetical protein BIW11_13002 [Tropilaelaps mercedesae]